MTTRSEPPQEPNGHESSSAWNTRQVPDTGREGRCSTALCTVLFGLAITEELFVLALDEATGALLEQSATSEWDHCANHQSRKRAATGGRFTATVGEHLAA